jgi:MFS family permease
LPEEAPSAAEPLSRNRDFTLLWIGQALSVFGTRVSWVAYPLLVLSLTQSPAKAGLVGFANWLPAVLVGLPAGALVDRWNRRRVMIVCDAGRALAVASLVGTLAAGIAGYPQIVAVAFLERSFASLFDPAETAAIRNLVRPGQLSTAIARNESREYGAFLLGPPLGGALFGVGRLLPFLADAVSYAASLVTLLLIRGEFRVEKPAERSHLAQDIRVGIAHMWAQPFLRMSAFFSGGSNFVTNGVGLAAIILAKQRLHSSPAAIGLMLTLSGAGGLLGSLAAPRLQARLSPRLVIAIATATWTFVIPLFLIAPNAYVLGALIGAALATAPSWNAVLGAYRIALTPDGLQGRVQSGISLFSLGGTAIGTLAAGVLFEAWGEVGTMAAFASVMAVIAVLSIWAPPVKRQLAVGL